MRPPLPLTSGAAVTVLSWSGDPACRRKRIDAYDGGMALQLAHVLNPVRRDVEASILSTSGRR
jgi:hypothetical protein